MTGSQITEYLQSAYGWVSNQQTVAAIAYSLSYRSPREVRDILRNVTPNAGDRPDLAPIYETFLQRVANPGRVPDLLDALFDVVDSESEATSRWAGDDWAAAIFIEATGEAASCRLPYWKIDLREDQAADLFYALAVARDAANEMSHPDRAYALKRIRRITDIIKDAERLQ